jgi:hypothetical protein
LKCAREYRKARNPPRRNTIKKTLPRDTHAWQARKDPEMMEREFVNAVELRPRHTGRRVEFTTMATPEMAADGHGALGSQVTFRGLLITVDNGRTGGRAWSRITLAPDDGAPLVTSVLGSHRRVELLAPADLP